MPDDIAVINGEAAFAYNIEGGLPWHGLGKPVQGRQDGASMQEAAQLNWQVVKQPLLTPVVNGTGFVDVPYKVATVRSTDSHVLGVVGPTYTVIQNDEMFAFAEALMKTGETVLFETAGALNDGKIVFALASVPERGITIDGDPQGQIMPYLILNSGHDGLRAFQAAFTPVRVVCRNTLNMALAGAVSVYKVRHTVKAADRVEAARRALRVNVEYIETLKAVSEELMRRPMTINDVKKFTVKLIPSTAEDDEKAVKAQRQRDAIVALYLNSANLSGIGDNAYRLMQAVAEYFDWQRDYRKTKRGSADDARALAILDGTALDGKDRALGLLMPKAQPRGAGGKFAKASA
jgi:phage/plasmid-like protein (TIGR03299 family)